MADTDNLDPDHNQIHVVHIHAPIETVWAAITRTGEKLPFYFNSILQAKLSPGSPLRYTSANGKRTFIVGEVIAVDAPRLFVHTLRFTHLAEPPSPVAFELVAEGDKTTVTIRHRDIAGKRHRSMVKAGWPFILNNLKSLLETGHLPFKTRVQNVVMRMFAPFMPREVP